MAARSANRTEAVRLRLSCSRQWRSDSVKVIVTAFLMKHYTSDNQLCFAITGGDH